MNKDLAKIILEIIKDIFIWGVGSLLIILGSLEMLLGKKYFDLNWPDYVWVGLVMLLLGIIILMIERLFALSKIKIKLKNKKEEEN